MSNLFVLGFDEPHKAEEVSLKLQELQGEYLLDLEEVIVAIYQAGPGILGNSAIGRHKRPKLLAKPPSRT